MRFFTTIRNISFSHNFIDIHPNVQNALSVGKPIVALESTIITHGMPSPFNLYTALEVEDIVRKEGSVPATIAILNGRIKVGLSNDQLKELANLDSSKVLKCSRRDLAYVMSKKLCGGTTVAGTMIIANMVGLKIFATGGIGGVHREGETTFDISADLIELGRTPVAVVSSGVKSILDIPRTLEFLETQGVCVTTYKREDRNFPDFYTPCSGCIVPYNVNSPSEAAKLIASSFDLNLKSGMLIGVPVPEKYAIDKNLIDNAIESALVDAKLQNITGKSVTPFLLSAISKITKGKSLDANIALIKNNAKVASQIAKELYRIPIKEQHSFDMSISKVPVVIGASILDLCLTLNDDFSLNGATYPVKSKLYGGGVGRNLADGLSKLYGNVNFISAVGNDEIGKNLLASLPKESTKGIKIDSKHASSICSVIFDKDGDCKLVLGNMEIHKAIDQELINRNESVITKAPLIIIDGNLPVLTMGRVLEMAVEFDRPVFYEPTDMHIAGRPFELPKELTKQIKFISPNIHELKQICLAINGSIPQLNWNEDDKLLENAKTIISEIGNQIDCVILTLGKSGVIIGRTNSDDKFFDSNLNYIKPLATHRSTSCYPADKVEKLVNVSGAGDSFSSGFISSMLNGYTEEECVSFGFYAANKALQSESAVPETYFKDDENLTDFNTK